MATITLTTTPQQDARISEALGAYLELGRGATSAEVKKELADHIRKIVYSYEVSKVATAAAAGVEKVTPT